MMESLIDNGVDGRFAESFVDNAIKSHVNCSGPRKRRIDFKQRLAKLGEPVRYALKRLRGGNKAYDSVESAIEVAKKLKLVRSDPVCVDSPNSHFVSSIASLTPNLRDTSSALTPEQNDHIITPPASESKHQTSVVIVAENSSSQDGQFEGNSHPVRVGSPSNLVSKKDKRERYYFRTWQLEILEAEFKRCSHPDTDARKAIMERLNKEFEHMKGTLYSYFFLLYYTCYAVSTKTKLLYHLLGSPLDEKEKVTMPIVHTWFANKRTKRIKKTPIRQPATCDMQITHSNPEFSLENPDFFNYDPNSIRDRFQVKPEPEDL